MTAAITAVRHQLVQKKEQLTDAGDMMAPGLMVLPGLCPIIAVKVIISYSYHGRIRSEAAFAALAGVSPMPVSSGNNVRHRLNHYGDRQLNRALHTIARTRMMFDAHNHQSAINNSTGGGVGGPKPFVLLAPFGQSGVIFAFGHYVGPGHVNQRNDCHRKGLQDSHDVVTGIQQ